MMLSHAHARARAAPSACGRGARGANLAPVACTAIARPLAPSLRPSLARRQQITVHAAASAPQQPLSVSVPAAREQITSAPAPAAPTPLHTKLAAWIQNTAKAVAVLGLSVALVLGNVNPAHAARSAGRAGGFSAPSASRSYGGGGGYSGGRGYSGGSGYTGYSGGYSGYRAPIIVPSPPIIMPGMGYGYGSGLMAAPGAAGVAVVSRGPDIVDIAIVSMFLVIAASAATTALKGAGADVDSDDYDAGFRQPTLTRVQVGLVSLARELKGDLDRIAAAADTGSSQGLHRLLQEVVLALLRNPSYCIYGAASQKAVSSTSSLETAFNSASVKERSKFEQETLVNVGGSTARRSSYRPSSSGSDSSKPNELVVVTMLVATGCKVNVPAKINSLPELRQALEALGGLPQDQVLGVELLWTPQAEGDYYTREEIINDYPHLRQL